MAPARIVPVLLVAGLLLAGCSGKTHEPAGTPSTPTVPATLDAPGATVTAVDGGVDLSWAGDLPTAVAAVSGPVNTASATATLPLRMPPEATLIDARLQASGNQADVTFRMAPDADGISRCGGVAPEDHVTTCFATRYAPHPDPEAWSIRLQAGTSDGSPVHYELKVHLGMAPLPILGPPPSVGTDAPAFAAPVRLSTKDTHTAEPSIAVTPGGTVYVSAPVSAQRALWRSTDGGATFAEVQVHGQATDPFSQYPQGGGDSDVAVSGESTVYFADQHVAETVSASHDGGRTWFTQPLGSGFLPLTDRQWLVTDGDLTAWLAFNGPNGATVAKTVDGGRTWPLSASMREDSCFRGNLARAPDGTLYFAGCNGDGPGVGVSTDGGLTWTWHLVAQRSGQTNTSFIFVAHLFVVATTDAAGNAYVVWSDEAQQSAARGAPDGPHGLNVWMSSSTDRGATWSAPKRVNHSPGTYVLPWATGGAAGHVAVSYYGTRFAGHPERVLGEWYPMLAVTADALSDQPSFSEAPASTQLAQYGPVCMRGSACGNARNLLDFFQIQADSGGLVHMAYVDGAAGGNYRLSDIMYVHQTGGAGLGGRSVDKQG